MDEWYDKLANDNDIRKKEINPRHILTENKEEINIAR